MRLIDFYNQIVRLGRKVDPRGNKSAIKSYADTAVLWGAPDTEVRKIMIGIDIDPSELLLADKLRSKDGLDLVLSHHPEGSAWAGFYRVMQMQARMLAKAGVAYKLALGLVEERMREVERKVISANHMRSVDTARILDMPFICAHTPADNHVAKFLSAFFTKKKPKQVGDIVDILSKIPEYKDAKVNNAGPRVIIGSPKRPVGKILLEMTGGTEGPKEVFSSLYKKGIRTLVSMHLSEEHFKKVKEENLSVVIAGHISSDTLGLNLLLDNIEKVAKEKFEVIGCSGFRRFSRS